jgi:putative RNA 2'-phosphotransferase
MKDSRYLSYILRHHPEEFNCEIDEFGWVDVNTLIKNTDYTLENLKEIVNSNTRFGFSEDFTKIKAFHGHSCKKVKYLEDLNPPNELYHGTSNTNYQKILDSEFIKSMNRNWVHLSCNIDKAKEVGSRHGEVIILIIDVNKMIKDGYHFYKSEDEVYLTNDIPIEYIKQILK